MSSPLRITAELPGSALKWIQAAEPVFQRQRMNLDHYTITVIDQEHTVVIMLSSVASVGPESQTPQAPPYPPAAQGPPPGRGSAGPLPGYEVELAKGDLSVVRANYVR